MKTRGRKPTLIRGDLFKMVVNDLHIKDQRTYWYFKKAGILNNKFAANPSTLGFSTSELFGNNDPISKEGFINLVKVGEFDTAEKITELSNTYPKWIPRNWKTYYGFSSIREIEECDSDYPVDLGYLLKAIHGGTAEVESSNSLDIHFDPQYKDYYLRVLKSIKDNNRCSTKLIRDQVGSEIDPYILRDYLIADKVIKVNTYNTIVLMGTRELGNLIKMIESGKHPISKDVVDIFNDDVEAQALAADLEGTPGTVVVINDKKVFVEGSIVEFNYDSISRRITIRTL